MILPINDQYRLAGDSHGWMIEKKCVRGHNGEQRTEWTPIGRYSTLTDAAEGYAEIRLRVSDSQNLAETLDEVMFIAQLCATVQPVLNAVDKLFAPDVETDKAN